LAHSRTCVVLLWMLFVSLAWSAPDASPRYGLSIRAGLALDEALQELSRQTGIQLLFFSNITAGRSAPELSGEYTITAALTRLLEGSDLTFRQVNEHTVEVRQAPTHSAGLSPKVRQSTPTPTSADQLQEVTVIATAEQLVAMRIPTPLQEIPQSISVISSEQIRQQNSFDLGDVLQNTPGISVRRTNSLDQNDYSRAFEVSSYHVDGAGALRPWFNNGYRFQGSPDMSEFDRVEVLRGSDALFSGNSDPGGAVSLVRKRPLSTPAFAMTTTLGSWNNYRVELDATSPLTKDGSLRGRADMVYGKRDYFFDQAHLNRKKLFAVVEYDFTPTATLTVGGSYQWDNALPLETSVIVNFDGSDAHLPRSTSLTLPWAFYNTRISEAYVQYRQQLADGWILKLNTTAGRTIVDFGYGTFNDQYDINHSLSPLPALFTIRPNPFTVGSMDATLTGKSDWFGLREVLAIGGDFTRLRGRREEDDYYPFGSPLTNVLTFDPEAYPDPRRTAPPLFTADAREEVKQYGGFVSLQVAVNDAFSLTGGARVASDTYRLSGSVASGGSVIGGLSENLGSSHVVQPYGALMYRMTHHLSWYASYADVYRTLATPYVRSNGNSVGPQQGVTFESGIKGAWRDGALNGSLALYRVEQHHVPVPDTPANPSSVPNCCYKSSTGRSQGVELEVDGELAPGWLIGSGYTYNGYQTGNNILRADATPLHLLKIWTSARLPGAFSGWTIGGNVRAQTASPGSLLENCDAQGQKCVVSIDVGTRPYAVFDLRAGYQLSPNWQVALSVNNAFDKRYYLSQGPNAGLWYGDPRNFMVRIDAKY
jgi:outer-membrane receptor for ferric coprogen and ferric-rhodotorulic acid